MLSQILENFINFLFPKSPLILNLESLSPSELLSKLTPAKDLGENTLAIFNYADENVRVLIWELKYRKNLKVAKALAIILFDVLKSEMLERRIFDNFSNPMLVPIPISRERRLERGYNQTEILCEEVINLDQEKLFEYKSNILEKTRHTESQTLVKNKKERSRNLENSMKSSGSVRGRNVIILDDVTTTGATFGDARRALKDVGAKKILCMALAH